VEGAGRIGRRGRGTGRKRLNENKLQEIARGNGERGKRGIGEEDGRQCSMGE
jgi:hypothetical protein